MPVLSTGVKVRGQLKPLASVQMQMAIDILQANRARLRQLLEVASEQNPLLTIQPEVLASGSGTLSTSKIQQEDLDFSRDHFDWIDEINEDFHHHFDETYSDLDLKSDRPWQENPKEALLFQPHLPRRQETLEKQLLEFCDDPKLREEALWLANYTDEQGLLEKPLIELASEYEKDPIELKEAQSLLQKTDPIGFGSDNLQEAILVQLKEKGHTNCLCHKLVQDHWKDLIQRKWQVLSKKTQTSLSLIEHEIKHHLQDLHTQFEPQDNVYPEDTASLDLVISFEKAEPDVKLLDNPTSWVQLEMRYLDQVWASSDKETKDYLKKKKTECLWLLKALVQREQNLIQVTKAIANWQSDYLNSKGPLKPMVLKDIATVCNLHESTVARACQDKLAQTPIGVLALKTLFCSKVIKEDGLVLSSDAICDRIKVWIKAEDPKQPLSDEEIVQKLKAEGMECARRTVAKYRARLGFAASHLRKHP